MDMTMQQDRQEIEVEKCLNSKRQSMSPILRLH